MALKRTTGADNRESVSVNKYISDTGFCSRRDADNLILHGRVTINENVAVPGNRVAVGDVVEVDGEPPGRKKAAVYIAYNKPQGITSTTDTADKTNIIDAIGFKGRIFPVGRLDKDSEGLIFLTNDGNIVNKMLRAGNAHEKEYLVTVDKPITPDFVAAMTGGVRILRTTTRPCKLTAEGKAIFRITLVQGLNRQIRRMCETLGYKVTRLKRVRIMNVHLGALPSGHWRYLTVEEQATLLRMTAGSEAGKAASPAHRAKDSKGENRPAKNTSEDVAASAGTKERGHKSSSFKEFRRRGKK